MTSVLSEADRRAEIERPVWHRAQSRMTARQGAPGVRAPHSARQSLAVQDEAGEPWAEKVLVGWIFFRYFRVGVLSL